MCVFTKSPTSINSLSAGVDRIRVLIVLLAHY